MESREGSVHERTAARVGTQGAQLPGMVDRMRQPIRREVFRRRPGQMYPVQTRAAVSAIFTVDKTALRNPDKL